MAEAEAINPPSDVGPDDPLSTAPQVRLPEFTGPLDLLLHLIQRNRFAITDIPIAVICDQYHEQIAAMQELDLDLAGEFLWMAAWLLHLKSRTVLPRVQSEEEGDDPQAELVERLLEYRRVKDLAGLLYDIDVIRRGVWPSEAPPPEAPTEVELDWEAVDLRLLARTYLRAMERCAAANPPPIRVIPLRYTVGDTMRDIYRRVRGEGLFPLLRHLHRRPDPEEVVTMVVATLELARLGGVRAEQRRPFAEIYLRPGPRELDPDGMLRGIDGA